MDYFNIFGFVFICLILIPNIIYALKHKYKNKRNNKKLELIEQIGRYGCIIFMIVNIPHTWYGWWSDEAFAIYLVINIVLILLYWIFWLISFTKKKVFTLISLAIIPSIIFLFSGIMSRSILLIISSLFFGPSHITITYNNCKKKSNNIYNKY